VDVGENPSAEEIALAKQRFRQGDIVRLVGNAVGRASAIGGVVLSNTHVASTLGSIRSVPGKTLSVDAKPLALRAVGLHRTPDRVVHQLVVFGSANDGDPDTRASRAFGRWAGNESARPHKAVTDPSAPGEAWMPLFNLNLVAQIGTPN
jgi:hypothetical protein